MSINDRGMKKWHGFFMPEHSGELKNLWHEDKKIKMPILDEYQQQDFEERLHYAVEYNLQLVLNIYVDGFIEKVNGFVHGMDPFKKEIKVIDMRDQTVFINFHEIVNL